MVSTKASLSAREQWEERQQQLYGCKYVDGVCFAHGTEQIASEPKPPCTCRSFPHAHELEDHDTLPGRFVSDMEQLRFGDASATDWRTQAERDQKLQAAADLFDETESKGDDYVGVAQGRRKHDNENDRPGQVRWVADVLPR